nr:hypothetical protein [uncultured Arsenicibacter sp.]
MRYHYLPTVCLLSLSLVARAQQKPQLNYTVDSVAIYTLTADALDPSREIWLQKGYVSHIGVGPEGDVSVGVFRQHNIYLNGDKAARIRSGLNTLPALLRTTFRNGQLVREGAGAPQEAFISLTSGLANPFTYRASQVSSLVGGVQAKTVLADNQQGATPLGELLTNDPKAIGYRGDRYIRRRFAAIGPDLVIDYQPYQFVPFSARYLPQGDPTMRKLPLVQGDKNTVLLNTRYPQQGRLSYFHIKDRSINTIDTLGTIISRVRKTDDLKVAEGMILLRKTEVYSRGLSGVQTPDQLNPVVATDWLFGPEKLKTIDPVFRVVRTDTDGKIVFDHTVTFSYPEFGYTQSEVLSDEGGCFVHVILGKGLLKYQSAYAYMTPKGVAWQHIWDKKTPEQVITIHDGNGPVLALDNNRQVVSQPDGRVLLISQKGSGFGVLSFTPAGLMERYFSVGGHPMTDGTPGMTPLLHVMPLPDSKLLLLAEYSRNSRGAQFVPYTTVDMALQEGLLPLPEAAPGQKTLFANATTGPLSFPMTDSATPLMNDPVKGARVALGMLKGKSLKEAVTDVGSGGSTGADGRTAKYQMPTENETYNASPVVYVLDIAAGTAAALDLNRYGYSLPNQPTFFMHADRKTLYVPLRTPMKPTEFPRSARYPQAVFLKLVTLSW